MNIQDAQLLQEMFPDMERELLNDLVQDPNYKLDETINFLLEVHQAVENYEAKKRVTQSTAQDQQEFETYDSLLFERNYNAQSHDDYASTSWIDPPYAAQGYEHSAGFMANPSPRKSSNHSSPLASSGVKLASSSNNSSPLASSGVRLASNPSPLASSGVKLSSSSNNPSLASSGAKPSNISSPLASSSLKQTSTAVSSKPLNHGVLTASRSSSLLLDEPPACTICGGQILVVIKSHPDCHAYCHRRKSKEIASIQEQVVEGTSVNIQANHRPGFCRYCSQAILIVYPSHPSIHAHCIAPERSGQPYQPPEPKKEAPFEAESFYKPESERRSYSTTTFYASSFDAATLPAGLTRDEAVVYRIMHASNYYQVLEVPQSCSEDDVKKSYRRLALATHPDKNKAEGSSEAFKVLATAFSCLSDPRTRRQYDAGDHEEISVDIKRRAEKLAQVSLKDLFVFFNTFNNLFRDINKSLWG